MRALAAAWSASGGKVIGLAVAQTAANVLAAEAGTDTHNIARWLLESTNRPDDPERRLRPGDLVIVDEVGMLPTRQLDQLRRQAETAGAKLFGVGDPLQLGPVGAGGAARLVANDVGATYLHKIHRFTHRWEADASLAIRAGDATAAHTYATHGRLHGGDRDTALAGAREAWLRDKLAGRDTLLLVGDVVMTRRNDRTHGVANRDTWHIQAITADGGLALRHADSGRTATIPASYVGEHVELGYAMTVHAAQGRTADAAHLVVTTGLDRELLYVGMTRGRSDNHAWVISEDFLHPNSVAAPSTPPTPSRPSSTKSPPWSRPQKPYARRWARPTPSSCSA